MLKKMTWKRILSIVISLAVIAYIGFQIYSARHAAIKTEYALSYTYYETVPVDALLVRREKVLEDATAGVVGYCQSTGSKVAAGSVVARVFPNSDQAAVQSRIDEIDGLVDSLKGLQTEGTQMAANAQTLDSRISDAINKMLFITDTGTTVGFNSAADTLIQYLNKKQLTLGTAADFNAYLAQLNEERNVLVGTLRSNTEITTEEAGYFVDQVDGYEDLIAYDTVADLTVDAINDAVHADVEAGSGVGKVITSNEWYLVTSVSNTVTQNMSMDGTVSVTIPLLSDEAYTCTVVAMNVDYATGMTALVLKGSQMNAALAQARTEKAEIRMNAYRGLRIHQSALRVVDGITGVYVVNGISAAFKPVDLLYSGAGFSICAYDAAKSGSLKLYDEVITEGSDLYDGKIIR